MTLTEQQKALIEKIGIFHESHGLQPAAARVVGLLYVSDKPELTFEEITNGLNISKSATSNAINLLLQTYRLEYITYSGDRKRYFRLKISNWRETFTSSIENLTNFSKLLDEVLSIRTNGTPAYNAGIAELSSFMQFIKDEMPGLLEKWEKNKA